MTNPGRTPMSSFRSKLSRFSVLSFALLLALAMSGAQAAHAQTYTVLHSFTRGQDGANPWGGLTIDRAGNLFICEREGNRVRRVQQLAPRAGQVLEDGRE